MTFGVRSQPRKPPNFISQALDWLKCGHDVTIEAVQVSPHWSRAWESRPKSANTSDRRGMTSLWSRNNVAILTYFSAVSMKGMTSQWSACVLSGRVILHVAVLRHSFDLLQELFCSSQNKATAPPNSHCRSEDFRKTSCKFACATTSTQNDIRYKPDLRQALSQVAQQFIINVSIGTFWLPDLCRWTGQWSAQLGTPGELLSSILLAELYF